MNTKSNAPKGPTFRAWAVQHGTPWEVVFPASGALPRQRRFFATEEEAKTEASQFTKGRKPEAALGSRTLDEVQYCRALLPSGVSLTDCVRYYLQSHSGVSSVTIQEVCDSYLLDLKSQRKSEDYQVEQARWASVFAAELGAESLFSTLGKAVLLKFIKSDTESYWNRYGRKRITSCLITKAIEMEALKVSPLVGWKFEEAKKSRPHFLTLADVTTILQYAEAHKPELVPAFALQLFAGIRTEELCRNAVNDKRPLEWKDITFGTRIDLGPEVTKTGDRRVIDFWPEALTSWMAPHKKTEGRVCELVELDNAKSKLIRDLNAALKADGKSPVDFRQNDFRRTYASHVCAYFQDASKAQLYLGQRDKDVLWEHYREYISEGDAKAYFVSKP
jgi:integrase